MGWFKRNLFFAIGLVVAVALLGASAYYIISSSIQNDKDLQRLQEIYDTLRNIPAGGDKPEVLDQLKKQTEELRQWVRRTRDYFQPISPIPTTEKGLTDDAFANALRRTVTQLQREAEAANVTLLPAYNFSFQAQSDKVRFTPAGSVEKLAVQLGEVKTISEILFAAHINALDGIQRLRVSDDDTAGAPTDYIDDQMTNAVVANLTPYQVTFRGFTDQIGTVLAGFATSPHGFLIKTINVQPVNAPGADMNAPVPAMPVGRAPQVVLDEQMLRVTVTIDVVNLTRG
jgi:hypothetical protein